MARTLGILFWLGFGGGTVFVCLSVWLGVARADGVPRWALGWAAAALMTLACYVVAVSVDRIMRG